MLSAALSVLAAAELVRLHVPGPWRSVAAIHTAQPAAQPTPAVPPAPGQALIDEDPIARIIAAHQAKLDLTAHRASGDVRNIVPRIIRLADNAGLPFLVVDKRSARLFIFDAQGRLLDDGPVLLGLARGDNTVPGIAERPLDQVRPFERTTPAGRFVARHGRNTAGEDVVWVDYGAAVSMHRVRATVAAERRLQRLASRTSADNRISFGCINLPPALYEQGVQPLLLRSPAVVYVLPETRPITKQFRSLFDDAPADHPGLRA